MSVFGEQAIDAAIQDAGRRLGFQLRPKQYEAVFNFARGRDVFVSLPTGSGKSLCYGVLPYTFDTLRSRNCLTETRSIVIVVSPLVALMEDQVASFTGKGIRSIRVQKEQAMGQETVDELHEGLYQMLFFSPESLLTDETWRDMIQSSVYGQNTVGFVVDKAHCVKKW